MKKDNSIFLIAPNFNQDDAVNCTLLVKIGMDSFTYAIINAASKVVYVIYDEQECKNVLLSLTERVKADSYLNLPYQATKIAIYSTKEISIPNTLFDENSINLHAGNFKKDDIVNQYEQNYYGFTTLFMVENSLTKLINNQFSNVKMFPYHTGLLTLAENIINEKLFLDFSANSFSLLFVNDGKVIFQKSFDIENVEEFNYYILLLIKQLNINTTQIQLNLSGIINHEDKNHLCLQKYFKNIEFNIVSIEYQSQIVADMPLHYYTTLLALNECV